MKEEGRGGLPDRFSPPPLCCVNVASVLYLCVTPAAPHRPMASQNPKGYGDILTTKKQPTKHQEPSYYYAPSSHNR